MSMDGLKSKMHWFYRWFFTMILASRYFFYKFPNYRVILFPCVGSIWQTFGIPTWSHFWKSDDYNIHECPLSFAINDSINFAHILTIRDIIPSTSLAWGFPCGNQGIYPSSSFAITHGEESYLWYYYYY